MILLIDNYDSFIHNIARYCEILGKTPYIIRNDKITVEEIRLLSPSHIISSPGPCTPNEAGICLELIKSFSGKVPILGICLGHQAIAQAFGARIIKAPWPCHGMSSVIDHNGEGLFLSCPDRMSVGRYHSLIVEEASLDENFQITARTQDGLIMAIAWPEKKLYGFQFHPESILTENGLILMQNFIGICSPESPRGFGLDLAS